MSERSLRFDIERVRSDIARLLQTYPELAEDADLRADTIEGELDFHAIAERLLAGVRGCETLYDAVGNRISALQKRRDSLDGAANRLRTMLRELMDDAGLTSLKLPEATLGIRPTPLSVVVTDEGALPEQYWRYKREPNKTMIKSALQDGYEVPGASLSNGGSALSVRIV